MARNIKKDWPPSGPLPMMLMMDRAAYELGVSESTLYEFLKEGKIKSVLLGPKIRRIPLIELEAYRDRVLAEQSGAEPPEQGAA